MLYWVLNDCIAYYKSVTWLKLHDMRYTLLFTLLCLGLVSFGQQRWSDNPFHYDFFVVNEGQYSHDFLDRTPSFGTQNNGVTYYLYEDGFTLHFEVPIDEKIAELKEWQAHELKERKEFLESDKIEDQRWIIEELEREMSKGQEKLTETVLINATWINANADAEFFYLEPLTNTYNFNTETETVQAAAYGMIIVKNLYDNIDLFYQIHPDGGIKYVFDLAGGADPSDIQMKWEGIDHISLEEDGSLRIESPAGTIKDAPPFTVEREGDGMSPVSYVVENDIVKFDMPEHNPSLGYLIDPWITPLVISATGDGLQVRSDYAGNTYVFGGAVTSDLHKYDASGVLQWTYSTGWAIGWHGSLEVDPNTGDSYLAHPAAAAQRVNTTGVQDWLSAFAFSDFVEPWVFNYNCQLNQLLLSGRKNLSEDYGWTTIDPMTGTSGTDFSFTSTVSPGNSEIRGGWADNSGRYYLLTVNSVVAVCPDFTVLWESPLPTPLDYFGPAYDTDMNPGANNSVASGHDHVFINDGVSVHKYDKHSGILLGSTPIALGTIYGSSGILTDTCGYVYVGTTSGIAQYDTSLALINSFATSGVVFDLWYGQSGEILASGNGFVGSFDDILTCGPIPCGSPFTVTVSPDTNICVGDSVQLFATGTGPFSWSPSAGLSDPTSATPWASPTTTTTYTVSVVQGCDIAIGSVTVSIGGLNIAPASPTICAGDSVDLTATGPGTITWSPGTDLSSTTGSNVTAWPSVTTTYTATSDMTCPSEVTITVNPSPMINVTAPASACEGDTITVYASGATSYSWLAPNILSSAGDSAVLIINNLTPITVTGDNGSGCTTDYTVYITANDCSPQSLVIPNVFSPNGDNLNDLFHITGSGIAEAIAVIMNRWGQELYVGDVLTGGWDGVVQSNGKEAPEGTYYFILDGVYTNGDPIEATGEVTLLR